MFSRDPLKRNLHVLKGRIADLDRQEEYDRLKEAFERRKRDRLYATAGPDLRQRLDAETEAARQHAESRRRPECRRVVFDPTALQLLTAAKQSVGQQCTVGSVQQHAQESILEALNGTPFAFDLIAEYRQLLQVPTLIRELWPYKPTIIRTLPMLDFARWICRVVYEECLTARGLVKGKINYVMRGVRIKVVPKDLEEQKKKPKREVGYEAEDESVNSEEQKGTNQDDVCKKAQYYVDQFIDQQEYADKRRERYRRNMIEGEAFSWIIDTADLEKESPELCFIEPDYIRPSQRNSTNQEDPSLGGNPRQPDWSFGIRTPHHQYWKPLEYQVVWNDNEEEKIPAVDICHTAIRERSNIKRCLPPMFAEADDLIRLTVLRAALADASKFRASIGGVVKFESASNNAVRSWAETISGGSYRNLDQPPSVEAITSDNYTNLISLPPGKDFVQGPDYPDINSLQAIYDWHIRAIAQAEQVPEWMVSGAAAESSYSSSLTSESAGIIEFESAQECECRVDRRIVRRVLQAYADAGKLPANFFEGYDVSCEGESMISRDVKAETETAIMAVDARLCSRHTAAVQLGFDPEREIPLIEDEEENWPEPEQTAIDNSADAAKTASGERQQAEGPANE